MEESEVISIKEHALTLAIIIAVSRVVIDFIPKILDTSPIVYYSTFVVCFIAEIIFIRYAIKKFKTLNNSQLNVNQAITIGLIIMVITGLVFGLSSYVYDKFLDPNFATNMTLKWGQMWGAEAEQAVLEQLEKNPPKPKILNIFILAAWFSFLGLIISAIIGSVMKSPKN